MTNKLVQLRKMTVVVSDTGDIDAIRQHKPVDATTNPSLIMKSADKSEYKHLVDEAVAYSKKKGKDRKEQEEILMESLFVNFGSEILKIIPGRVSTEVDANLSFDVEGSLRKARSLIKHYEELGIDRKRVLIKLASTWEGTVAAKQLEQEGIHCNMTLLFNLPQAIACAEVGATLISPFVGRILDWYKKHEGVPGYPANKDPGVKSVHQIYHYFKKFGFKTEIMGASFRNKEEVLALSGCDLLTISPQLLQEIEKEEGTLERMLDPSQSKDMAIERLAMNEKKFRWLLNEDAMATEKLAEGIRVFAKDAQILKEKILKNYF